ncbi:MAG: protein tyrosine phosphatase [Bacteroidetes bacterium QS_8_68_28]|nr:MAG: protein tyrosine phosphatase [Bacteroidetes bacterium QS_8_68_28]
METASDATTCILFVCLGNICRSPLAEGLFKEKVRKRGLENRFCVESAGTGDWHLGQPPDDRMQAAARRNGDLDISEQRAQQFAPAHFEDFDHIFAMDKSNLHDVLFLDEEEQYDGKVRLFREFDPQPGDYQVPDPYAGGREGFDRVYRIADRTTARILEALLDDEGEKGGGEDGEKASG